MRCNHPKSYLGCSLYDIYKEHKTMSHRNSCWGTPLPPLLCCPALLLWMTSTAPLAHVHKAFLPSPKTACAGYRLPYSSAQVHHICWWHDSGMPMTQKWGRVAKRHDRTWIVLSGKKLLQSCTSLCLQNVSRVEDLTAWPCQIAGKERRRGKKRFPACIQ